MSWERNKVEFMPQLTEKRSGLTPRSLRLARSARPIPTFVAKPKSGISARAVGSYVPGLTRTAFEKHGFAAASLITDWARIVGPELAAFTAPERLKWPQGRGVATAGETAEARPAATLVLLVDPARALDAEYRARQIMERTNTYFGYRAVGEIKILQAAPGPAMQGTRAHAGAAIQPTARAPQAAALPGIEDAGLAQALGRLKAGMDRQAQ